MGMVSIVLSAAIALLITFLSGFLALHALTFFSSEETWAFSGAAGVCILGSISFVAFLLRQFQKGFYICLLLFILFLCIGIIKLGLTQNGVIDGNAESG